MESESISRRPCPSQNEKVKDKHCKVFFDSGIVHHEYAPEGQKINKVFFPGVLRQLCTAVRKKPPDMWRANNFHLCHDNALAHLTHVIQDFFCKKRRPTCFIGSVLSVFGIM